MSGAEELERARRVREKLLDTLAGVESIDDLDAQLGTVTPDEAALLASMDLDAPLTAEERMILGDDFIERTKSEVLGRTALTRDLSRQFVAARGATVGEADADIQGIGVIVRQGITLLELASEIEGRHYVMGTGSREISENVASLLGELTELWTRWARHGGQGSAHARELDREAALGRH